MRLEFASKDQINKDVVRTYVEQAIAVEKSGLKVDFKAKRELELPKELTVQKCIPKILAAKGMQDR